MSRELFNVEMVCRTRGCGNAGVPIWLRRWSGGTVFCGPCGGVIKDQTCWYQPPSPEELGVEPAPQRAADLIAQMTPAERAELAALIAPNEGETQ